MLVSGPVIKFLKTPLVPCVTVTDCTRCSAITERPRCRVRYSFWPKVEDWHYKTTNIIGLSPTTVI